jgi:drug/metabolite transporter (DMT)-like permease
MGGRITVLSLQGALTLLALALFAAVAYVLSLIPLKYFPASEVSVFNLLITVFGVVMSGLVLGENIFRANYIISLALIVIGIMLVNKRSKTHEGKNI